MRARRQQASGSSVVASNFQRLAKTFPAGTAPFVPTAPAQSQSYYSPVPGADYVPSDGYVPDSHMPSGGTGFAPPPLAGGSTRYGVGQPPVSDTAPFVASEVYNKVGILAAIAVAGGAVTFLFPISTGLVLGLILVAFGLAIATTFSPRRARVLAPLYAVTEGLALGGISRFFEESSKGIVPLAIIFTGAVFAATLAALGQS
jgi:hypothetical protein